jgi:hypothetical protein
MVIMMMLWDTSLTVNMLILLLAQKHNSGEDFSDVVFIPFLENQSWTESWRMLMQNIKQLKTQTNFNKMCISWKYEIAVILIHIVHVV